MARPHKNNADYFPHDNDLRNDRRCKALRGRFHHEGYSVFTMLLEVLTQSEYFQIEKNALELELLAGDFDINSERLNEILDYLIKLGLMAENNNSITSPLLSELKEILLEHRAKERKRKQKDNTAEKSDLKTENGGVNNKSQVFQPENPEQLNVFPKENTQSKVNESKVNKSEEKGNKEIEKAPHLNSSFDGLDEKEKEKSSGKKENGNFNLHQESKKYFLQQASTYYWEAKDNQHLQQLLNKIRSALPGETISEKVFESFQLIIQNIPVYWRTKKFTMQHLNENYNEIINEIKTKTNEKRERDGSPDGKFGRHRADDLADRARTFGRKRFGN